MAWLTGKRCRLVSMFALTAAFFLIEVIVGYAANSMALVADSFHMLSDIVALVIAYLSVRMAPKAWDRNTYGWARAEVLGSLVNAVFLVALCFSITVESLKRFYEVEEVREPQLILWVGVTGLIINMIGLCLFHQHGSAHGHSHGGHAHHHPHVHGTHSHLSDLAFTEINDNEPGSPSKNHSNGHSHAHCGAKSDKPPQTAEHMNMRGVFLHLLADALGSVVVIISALVIWLTDWKYRDYVDPTLSLILVIIMLRSVWPLLMGSALVLLQTVPVHIDVDALKRKLLERVDGVLDVHEFHVWQLTGNKIIASAHIRCHNLQEYMKIAENVKAFFHNEGIHATTVQPEFAEKENGLEYVLDQDCVLVCPKKPFQANPPCQASQCCPTPKSVRGTPVANRRQLSFVDLEACQVAASTLYQTSTPNRRSVPNLAALMSPGPIPDSVVRWEQRNRPSEEAQELTAELDLSDRDSVILEDLGVAPIDSAGKPTEKTPASSPMRVVRIISKKTNV